MLHNASSGKIVEDVLSTACTQRAWDHFTKPQRKSITQWKDYATVSGLLEYMYMQCFIQTFWQGGGQNGACNK